MTLAQLRLLREIARRQMSISAAAEALNVSQPAVSRQIHLLERELGIDILLRRRNRIAGLTETGAAVLRAAERVLAEAEGIRAIAAESTGAAQALTLATSHLHARYTLLDPVRRFAARHPEVRLHIQQAEPAQVLKLVADGSVDIGVTTESRQDHPDVALVPVAPMARSLIVPPGHPLARADAAPGLAEIAAWPMVGYAAGSRGGEIVGEAFRAAGLALDVVVRASDADVVKDYVAAGLGTGIVPALSLGRADEPALHARDVTSLFPPSAIMIGLRREARVPRHAADFVRALVPDWRPGARR